MNKTCADCIHNDVCFKEHLPTDLDPRYYDYSSITDVDECCEDFKDKSRYIELPCAVGDKVYYIHETYWDKDYKNQVINDNVRNRILKIVERQNHATNLALEVIHFDYCFITDWIKGDIFLTKEEAEQVLHTHTSGELNYIKAQDLDKDSPEFKKAVESLKRL